MGTTPEKLEEIRTAVEEGLIKAANAQEYQLKDGTRVRRKDAEGLNALRKNLAAEEAGTSNGFFVPVQFGDPA